MILRCQGDACLVDVGGNGAKVVAYFSPSSAIHGVAYAAACGFSSCSQEFATSLESGVFVLDCQH